MKLLNETLDKIKELDKNAMKEAKLKLDSLLKPQGSLGKLEEIAIKVAGITGKVNNTIKKKAMVVMASDNGITEEKVSSFPLELTKLVAQTMLDGIAGISVLTKCNGIDLKVVDIGISGDIKEPYKNFYINKVAHSTKNMTKEPAMTRDEAVKAIEVGIEMTNILVKDGYDILGTGEVGISNTTTSSAVLYALTKGNLDDLVGRGGGLTDEGLIHKKEMVKKAYDLNKPNKEDAIDVLSKLGGFDIAGMTGLYLGAAANRVPIIIDGFISGVAAVLAYKINPLAREYMITSHGTEEPGKKAIMEILDMDIMLNLNMRLGEGTGGALAFNIVDSALAIINTMGTFADIGM